MSNPAFEKRVLFAALPLIGRLLKLRYLLFGSAVGGGYAIHNRYKEIKDSLPSMSWIRDVLPEDMADKISDSYANVMSSISTIDLSKLQKKTSEMKRNVAQKYSEVAASVSEMTATDILKESKNEAERFSQEAEKLRREMRNIQTEYQREVERLEEENRRLKKQVLISKSKSDEGDKLIMKKSLIDMYSDVLDELSEFDSNYRVHDQLPRVVVVGDQSSGKTSVLEMLTQARIFPRGAGEMMTRSPVKVTLSSGPYHVARLRNDPREFDLDSEEDRQALRDEIERRMKKSVMSGETISNQVISLSVQGPGLQRMVLVDLPGIISTETQGMAMNTKQAIVNLAKSHMSNPNAIILCIQDGSIDAERSNVTDLVSSIDPQGKRTIFVLTKVDMAEENELKPDRIKRILEGQLFPMKALGYFAVVTGTGNPLDTIEEINQHERYFFNHSRLVKDGILRPGQITTKNLSMAVSNCFWNMVKQSIAHQSDAYRATRYNLEAEWKNMFRGMRQQSRDDIYDRAKYELLDELVKLSEITPESWQKMLFKQLWVELRSYFVKSVLIPAWEAESRAGFDTKVDILLGRAIEESLPSTCVKIARDLVLNSYRDIISKQNEQKKHDPIVNQVEEAILKRIFDRFQWDTKAEKSLRMIQTSLLEDKNVPDRVTWDKTLDVMDQVLREEVLELRTELKSQFGHGWIDQWLRWKPSPSKDQLRNRIVFLELQKLLQTKTSPKLLEGDIVTVCNNVKREFANSGVTEQNVRSMWPTAYLGYFLETCEQICSACHQFYSFYQRGFTDQGLDCREVEFFWRVNRILESTSNALRVQISSVEARRLERILREVLDELASDEDFKRENIVGRRVDLAERLIKVRSIQQHLEEFMTALNEE